MKKKLIIAILLIVLAVCLIISYISNKRAPAAEDSTSTADDRTEETSLSDATLTETKDLPVVTISPDAAALTENASLPEDTAPQDTAAEASETEFTEGIRITKYPGDYASFKFETPDGTTIISDPFLMNEVIQPDIVTESHQDLDHNDETLLIPPYELITKAGEYTIGDVTIRGFAGKHNKGGGEGSNNIFVIQVNDITIAHFASQGEVPSEEVLYQINNVDVLLIQAFVNPNYNKLVFEDIDTIISKLNPKIIIPEHCGEDSGSVFAKYLNITEENEDSGSVIITRSMLDNTEGLRLISLENNYE
jgi:hypothetical protein